MSGNGKGKKKRVARQAKSAPAASRLERQGKHGHGHSGREALDQPHPRMVHCRMRAGGAQLSSDQISQGQAACLSLPVPPSARVLDLWSHHIASHLSRGCCCCCCWVRATRQRWMR